GEPTAGCLVDGRDHIPGKRTIRVGSAGQYSEQPAGSGGGGMMAHGPRGTVADSRSPARSATGEPPTDRELLDRFATGRDEEAFASLVHRHGPMVLGVCRRVLRDREEAQ